ncbi:S26 family signal peptidase [Ferrimicrobium sp.]|uniref:S26 family signal peptidase n=2 Tax=Ferrimicrobium sp. TaxID=2926050 RepID=UPI00345D72B4
MSIVLGPPSLAMVSAALAWVVFQRYEVVGDSMRPTLLHGDRLLILRWRWVPVGQILVVRDARSPDDLVKRLIRRSRSSVWIEGDNTLVSTDSRQMGWFSKTGVVGWAIYRYYPPNRAGSLIGG